MTFAWQVTSSGGTVFLDGSGVWHSESIELAAILNANCAPLHPMSALLDSHAMAANKAAEMLAGKAVFLGKPIPADAIT